MNCFPPSPSAIFFHFATCNSKLSIGGSAERVEAVPRRPETWRRVESNDGVALFIVVPLASKSLLNHSHKTPTAKRATVDYEPSGLARIQPINYFKDGPSSTTVTQRGTNSATLSLAAYLDIASRLRGISGFPNSLVELAICCSFCFRWLVPQIWFFFTLFSVRQSPQLLRSGRGFANL